MARLCLSATRFGSGTGEHEAIDIIARYRGAGGNFIDATGDAGDISERIVGRALQRRRDRWIIAATAPRPGTHNSSSKALSGGWLRQAAEQSLDRLQAEKIDVFYLRFSERMGRLEEMVETLGDLIQAGKIGCWGFANFRAWKIAELVRMADCLDAPRPVAAQPCYHALHRLVEMDYLPACAHFSIGTVPYAPLAMGVLSEESRNIQLPPHDQANRMSMKVAELRPAARDAVHAIARHLEPSGRAMAGFALRWVLANRLVSSVLIRPDSLAQLETYLSAAATPYTQDDEAFINELVPSGNSVGAADVDPSFGQNGRIVE